MRDHREADNLDDGRERTRQPVDAPAGADTRLPSWDYPWSPATESGLLAGGRFTPMAAVDLLRHAASRCAVVAVGSNASPVVLLRKLSRHGTGGEVPFLPGTLTGCGVGHSAHVSVPGYVAAAPYRAEARHTPVYISLLDDRQLDCLDATEPHYVRRELSGSKVRLAVEGTATVEVFHLYDSRWGVIAPPGEEPLPLRSQEQLHAYLREHWPPYTDLVLARPDDATAGWTAGARAVMDRLAADPSLRTRVREALRESGWARTSGVAD